MKHYRIIFLMCLAIIVSACNNNNVIVRDLTGWVVLDEVKPSNDTVDFYIRDIILTNLERSHRNAKEAGSCSPGVEIIVTVTNKSDKYIYLMPFADQFEPSFLGILSVEPDSVYGIGFLDFNESELLAPDSSADYSTYTLNDLSFIYDTDSNDIDPMLDIIRQTEFYYIPSHSPCIYKSMGEDTILINTPHRLRTDANTNITSFSVLDDHKAWYRNRKYQKFQKKYYGVESLGLPTL